MRPCPASPRLARFMDEIFRQKIEHGGGVAHIECVIVTFQQFHARSSLQSSGVIATLRPSIAASKGIWQESRDRSVR